LGFRQRNRHKKDIIFMCKRKEFRNSKTHLVYSDDVRVMKKLHCSYFALYLKLKEDSFTLDEGRWKRKKKKKKKQRKRWKFA
jgi:hypothetical protein